MKKPKSSPNPETGIEPTAPTVEPVGDPPASQSAPPTQTPPASPEGSESLDSIAGHVQDQAPEPNQEAIGRVDKKNKRGEGQEGKKRGPYGKKGNRPDGPKMSEQDEEKYKRCYMAGVESCQASVAFAAQMLGDKWYFSDKPIKIKLPDGRIIETNERDRMTQAWGNAFAYKGWEGPNPMTSLYIISLGFVASRLRDPEVRAQAKGFFQKIMQKYKDAKKAAEQRKMDAATAESKVEGAKAPGA